MQSANSGGGLLCLEKRKVIFYTAGYEDFKPIFFTTVGGNFCDAVAGADGTGMDDADYVHDEVLVKVRH